jgi:hypothetical protein
MPTSCGKGWKTLFSTRAGRWNTDNPQGAVFVKSRLSVSLVLSAACLLLAFALSGCGEDSSFKPLGTTGLSLSPDSTAIKPGGQVAFTAVVTGFDAGGLNWYVNDELGGGVIFGTITPEGVYSAPIFIPNDPVVVVKAVSIADTNYYAQASVRIITSVAVEMENYESTEGIGIHVASCGAASGGKAVDGCDNEGEAIFYRVAFDHPGTYSSILRAAATKLEQRTLRITVFASLLGGEDQVIEFDIEGQGIG